MYGRNSCMASPLIGYETYSPQQDNSISIKLSPSSHRNGVFWRGQKRRSRRRGYLSRASILLSWCKMKDLDIAEANCDKILLEKVYQVVPKWASDVPCDYYLLATTSIWHGRTQNFYHLSILCCNIDYSSQALSKRPSWNKKAVANTLATSTQKEYWTLINDHFTVYPSSFSS